MQDALKKLPRTLKETYTVAITRMIESEHVHDAGKLLMWLAYAFEPLSIEQVTDILAVDLEAQKFNPELRSLEIENGTYDILDSTLITVSVKKIVQLAHNSVKEFLTQSYSQNHFSELIVINEHLAHATICQTCLVYLLYFDSPRMYDFKMDYPLALYAGKNWPLHMKTLENRVSEHRPAKMLAIKLLKDGSQLPFVNWIRIHKPDERYDTQFNPYLDPSKISTPLYYMAFAGLLSVVKHLLDQNNFDVNAQEGEYGNALQAAVYGGNKNIVQLLLEHGADVNAQGGGYKNALQAAVYKEKKDIVQLLLEHKADVNCQGGYYGNALQAAARRGKKDIVQLLLEHKANVNAPGGGYRNVLEAAVYTENRDIVQLLLEHNADVNAQVGDYGNVLQSAVYRENKDIVQLLLEYKADVNAQGGRYGNALQAAINRGNKDIVQLLLEHKADVNAQGATYGNALLAAINRGNKDIVQLLLEHKADVNAQGATYGNALQAAVNGGNRDVVQLLLQYNADVDAPFYRESKDIAHYKADADAQLEGNDGNALQAASRMGNNDIVQLLLVYKADVNAQGASDVNAQGGYFGNALQAAAITTNKGLVQLLLECKADVNAQGGVVVADPTMTSCHSGTNSLPTLLTDPHSSESPLRRIPTTGGVYGNALQIAVSMGNKNIVQCLLEYKADVNAQGGYYGSALQAAVSNGHKDIVQLLLGYKANVNAQGGVYGNALQAAAFMANRDIIQLLLEHKADVNAQGGDYGNEFQAALHQKAKEIVQIFLEDNTDKGGPGPS
ncbi:ankyrin repeat-containing domain protein [Rhodocollybia butyracea]|uniref:Ankyrin repeat-containing domain protein n=1 Tax=Rhodocollybia butyracea TaxID=206335 RepID=A0A9P5P6N0_9AGAR|nr:ankyrin repeat-containing domain protein [Rhodocollybia butyracea]